MPKAYDRIKNTDNRGDYFIKTPYWTVDVEDAFEVWAAARPQKGLEALLDGLLGSDVAVSFKTLNASICCTLAHQPSKDAQLPYLLTGWSDNSCDALYVALYKLEVMLQGIWEAPVPERTPRRH